MKKIDKILALISVFIGLGVGVILHLHDTPANATPYNATTGSRGVWDALSVRGLNGLPSADFDKVIAKEITVDNTRTAAPHVQINGSLSVKSLNQYSALEVDNITVTGPLILGGTAGTSGQVIQSNGAGAALSWVGATAGSTTDPVYIGYQGGTQASMTAIPTPAVSAYVIGQQFTFLATAQGSTQGFVGAPTLAISGLDAKQVTDKNGTALGRSTWKQGESVTVVYDGTYFRLKGNPAIPNIKYGTLTRDISLTSVQSVTGVGFAPKYVELFYALGAQGFGRGHSNGTTHNSMGMNNSNGGGHTDATGNGCIVFYQGTGYAIAKCNITGDGFDLDWVATSAPAGVLYIQYLAYE